MLCKTLCRHDYAIFQDHVIIYKLPSFICLSIYKKRQTASPDWLLPRTVLPLVFLNEEVMSYKTQHVNIMTTSADCDSARNSHRGLEPAALKPPPPSLVPSSQPNYIHLDYIIFLTVRSWTTSTQHRGPPPSASSAPQYVKFWKFIFRKDFTIVDYWKLDAVTIGHWTPINDTLWGIVGHVK